MEEGAVVEPPESPTLLETLIASIDENVESAFGPGGMADLGVFKGLGEVEGEQHIIFSLDETEYAAHIDSVIEIGEPLTATPVPNAPEWVLGVANLRGDIVSMVDLRVFLGMQPSSKGHGKRMLIAQAHEAGLSTCLIVDRVSGIRYLDLDQITDSTQTVPDRAQSYVRGFYDYDGQSFVVFDLDRLLLSEAMRGI